MPKPKLLYWTKERLIRRELRPFSDINETLGEAASRILLRRWLRFCKAINGKESIEAEKRKMVAIPSGLSFDEVMLRLRRNDPEIEHLHFEEGCEGQLYMLLGDVEEALKSSRHCSTVWFPVNETLWNQLVHQPVAESFIEHIQTSQSLKSFGVTVQRSGGSPLAASLITSACQNPALTRLMAVGVTFHETQLWELCHQVSRLDLWFCYKKRGSKMVRLPDDAKRTFMLKKLWCFGFTDDAILGFFSGLKLSQLETLKVWQFVLSAKVATSLASLLGTTSRLTHYDFSIGYLDKVLNQANGRATTTMEQLVRVFKSLAQNKTLESLDLFLPAYHASILRNNGVDIAAARTFIVLTERHIQSNPNLVELGTLKIGLKARKDKTFRALVKNNKRFLEALEGNQIPPELFPIAIQRGMKSRRGREAVFRLLTEQRLDVYCGEDDPPDNWAELCTFEKFEALFDKGVVPSLLDDEWLDSFLPRA